MEDVLRVCFNAYMDKMKGEESALRALVERVSPQGRSPYLPVDVHYSRPDGRCSVSLADVPDL